MGRACELCEVVMDRLGNGYYMCPECLMPFTEGPRREVLTGAVTWGAWRYDPTRFELAHEGGTRIDLLRFDTASSALHFINQIADDASMADADIGALVRAVAAIRGSASGPMFRALPERELLLGVEPTRIPPRRSGVYVVRCGPVAKIGCAVDIAQRIRGLQTAHHELLELVGVLSDSTVDEGRWHALFAHLRVRGEWFHFGEQIAVWVRDARRRDASRAGVAGNVVSIWDGAPL